MILKVAARRGGPAPTVIRRSPPCSGNKLAVLFYFFIFQPKKKPEKTTQTTVDCDRLDRQMWAFLICTLFSASRRDTSRDLDRSVVAYINWTFKIKEVDTMK
jgi:hypothetical protein